MKELLEKSLCDSMYKILNNSTIFKYDEELKAKHSQVCAVLDRLRHAIGWINNHQDTPAGLNTPTQLMTFMMFASLIKDSVENIRKEFGLNATIFDKGRYESKKFFANICCKEPLNISEDECPTDDAFFQYFRSLVFAHSGKIEKHQGILRQNEVQYCPFIVEYGLKYYETEPNDYVGVKIYSTVEDRDGKILRVRFSVLKEYLRTRYESLQLVVDKINGKIKDSQKVWKWVCVDPNLSPLEQMKFMSSEFTKRREDNMAYEVGRIIDILEAPCSLIENVTNVAMYRKEIEKAVPDLVQCFTSSNHARFIDIVDHFTSCQIDESSELNYILCKVFEYLDDEGCREWATPNIDIVVKDFAKKWVRIDSRDMPSGELKMLITLACYNEYGRCQPISKEIAKK